MSLEPNILPPIHHATVAYEPSFCREWLTSQPVWTTKASELACKIFADVLPTDTGFQQIFHIIGPRTASVIEFVIQIVATTHLGCLLTFNDKHIDSKDHEGAEAGSGNDGGTRGDGGKSKEAQGLVGKGSREDDDKEGAGKKDADRGDKKDGDEGKGQADGGSGAMEQLQPANRERIAEYDTSWEHLSQKNQPYFYSSIQVKFPRLPPANVNADYAGRISLHIVESSWKFSTGHLRIMLGGNARHLIAKSSHPVERIWQKQETVGAGITAQLSNSPNATTSSVSRPDGTISTTIIGNPVAVKGVAFELIPFRYHAYTLQDKLDIDVVVRPDVHSGNNTLPISAQIDYFFKGQRPDKKNNPAEINMLCGSLMIDDIYTYQTANSSCKTFFGKSAIIPTVEWNPTKNAKGSPVTSALLFHAGSAIFPKERVSRFLRKTPSGTPLLVVDVVLFEWKDGTVTYEDIAQTSKIHSYFPDRFA